MDLAVHSYARVMKAVNRVFRRVNRTDVLDPSKRHFMLVFGEVLPEPEPSESTLAAGGRGVCRPS